MLSVRKPAGDAVVVYLLMAVATMCGIPSGSPGSRQTVFTEETDSITLGRPTSSFRYRVSVSTDKTRYDKGEVISVTLKNMLSKALYAPPPGRGYCSVVTLQRLTSGDWETQGSCDTPAGSPLITLGPNTVMTAPLILDRKREETGSPAVSAPVTPGASSGKAPTRSSKEPEKPGEPIPVFPEGIINVRGLLYPALDHMPAPGMYRILFAFTVDEPSGVEEVVYSEAFHILG